LYDLLDYLPSWGHYKTAMVMSDTWAARALDLEEAGYGLPPTVEDEDSEPTPLYYDPTVARLDLIADRVMSVRTAVQASFIEDHKEPSFDPIPRPVTAMDRERQRRVLNELNDLDLQLRAGLSLVVLNE
jgi:hypothetical protein